MGSRGARGMNVQEGSAAGAESGIRVVYKMEMSDSRKRPLDGDFDGGASKRSNQGGGLENIHLKVLIPSIAAGAIIGKGGETITQIQKETGAVIKMSKANDFYPGTTERVCLITGCKEDVVKVHDFIMEKIREKPDPNPKPVDGDLKVNFERHKQVKVLIPNTTAGMVIGKGGVFIRQIKDQSGAYVQISQKSKDLNLPERCVTIAGDVDQNRAAVELIIGKIVEDPQSGSCPNISYQDYKGPVASSNPTGSPFANAAHANGNQGGMNGNQPFNSGTVGTIGTGMNNLNLNSGGNGISNPALENLKATLRGSGYAEQAVEEISAAMYTLANYGFLGLGLGLGINLGNNGGGGGGGGGMGNVNSGVNMGNQQGGNNLNLANLAGILSGNAPNNGASLLGANSGGGADSNPSVFGPVGSTTTTQALGDTGEGTGPYFSSSSDRYAAGGDSVFSSSFNNSSFASGYSGTNQNSFGLGTNMGTFGSPSEEGDGSSKKDVEVGEHIVGAILGPGGKGIVELQKFSGANIQISKKGVYAPGTRNRIVTIAGSPNAVQRAQYLIQQRIVQEENKRSRQGPGPAR